MPPQSTAVRSTETYVRYTHVRYKHVSTRPSRAAAARQPTRCRIRDPPKGRTDRATELSVQPAVVFARDPEFTLSLGNSGPPRPSTVPGVPAGAHASGERLHPRGSPAALECTTALGGGAIARAADAREAMARVDPEVLAEMVRMSVMPSC